MSDEHNLKDSLRFFTERDRRAVLLFQFKTWLLFPNDRALIRYAGELAARVLDEGERILLIDEMTSDPYQRSRQLLSELEKQSDKAQIVHTLSIILLRLSLENIQLNRDWQVSERRAYHFYAASGLRPAFGRDTLAGYVEELRSTLVAWSCVDQQSVCWPNLTETPSRDELLAPFLKPIALQDFFRNLYFVSLSLDAKMGGERFSFNGIDPLPLPVVPFSTEEIAMLNQYKSAS